MIALAPNITAFFRDYLGRQREAINAITPLKVRKGRFRPPDELIARLKSSSLWGADQSFNSPAKGLGMSNSP